MVRFHQSVLAFVVCCAVLPTAMHANCAVFASLDRVHFFQQVLRDQNAIISSDTIVSYLKNQMNALDDGLVLRAVSTHPAADAPTVFANYIRNTRTLLGMTMTVSNRVIPLHFDAPRVQSNFITVGHYLSDLRCPGPIGGASFHAVVSNFEAALADKPAQDPRLRFWSARNIILLIAGLLSIAVIAKIVREWVLLRRRRFQRYPCNYETVVRYGREYSDNGTVIDISMKGVKLRRLGYLAEGSRIEIRILDQWCEGTVVWSNTHYSGIVFSRSLGKQAMRHIRTSAPGPADSSNGRGESLDAV